MGLWHYCTRGWAKRAWDAWIAWARRCRLDPVKRVAQTVHRHLEGILTAIVHGVTNAAGESINAIVQRFHERQHGFGDGLIARHQHTRRGQHR
jgi:transposase